MVDVFMHNGMTSVGAPLPQLPQLVLGVLAFLIGTDASVDSYAHGHGSLLVEERILFLHAFYHWSSAHFMRVSSSGFYLPFFHEFSRGARHAELAVDFAEERSRLGMEGSPDIGADQATHARASVGDCGPLWSRPQLAKTLWPRPPSSVEIVQQRSALPVRVFFFRFFAVSRGGACFPGNAGEREGWLWAWDGWTAPPHGQGYPLYRLLIPLKNISDFKNPRGKYLGVKNSEGQILS